MPLKAIELLNPRLRNLPLAQEFADMLASASPEALEVFDGSSSYGWDADIPPRVRWCREATEFAAHVDSL